MLNRIYLCAFIFIFSMLGYQASSYAGTRQCPQCLKSVKEDDYFCTNKVGKKFCAALVRPRLWVDTKGIPDKSVSIGVFYLSSDPDPYETRAETRVWNKTLYYILPEGSQSIIIRFRKGGKAIFEDFTAKVSMKWGQGTKVTPKFVLPWSVEIQKADKSPDIERIEVAGSAINIEKLNHGEPLRLPLPIGEHEIVVQFSGLDHERDFRQNVNVQEKERIVLTAVPGPGSVTPVLPLMRGLVIRKIEKGIDADYKPVSAHIAEVRIDGEPTPIDSWPIHKPDIKAGTHTIFVRYDDPPMEFEGFVDVTPDKVADVTPAFVVGFYNVHYNGGDGFDRWIVTRSNYPELPSGEWEIHYQPHFGGPKAFWYDWDITNPTDTDTPMFLLEVNATLEDGGKTNIINRMISPVPSKCVKYVTAFVRVKGKERYSGSITKVESPSPNGLHP